MKSYNGFSPEQREKAQAWLRRQWDAGELERPKKCCACGQTDGVLDAHAEDYSEPFGPHISEFPLCYLCHMMVHCRFGSGATAFHRYETLIAEGFRFPAFARRNFDYVRRLLDLDETVWAWASPARSPRPASILTVLANETPAEREQRIAGYHQVAA